MKRLIGLLMVLGLITLCTFPLAPKENTATKPKTVKQQIKKIEVQVQQADDDYRDAVQSLLKENDSLIFAVTYAKDELQKSKRKVSFLQKQIDNTIAIQETVPDTASKLAYCDSLKSEIVNLIVESSIRDSLCDSTVSILSAQVQNKDSSFKICEKSYEEMKNLLDSSLLQQMNLAEELNKYCKKVRRKVFQSRLLAGGAMVLSGFIAYQAIRRKN